MSVILMTTLFYKVSILQGEIWCWSLWGLKGLITKALTTQRWASSGVSFPGYVDDRESCIAAPARKRIRAPSTWESCRALPATYCFAPAVFHGLSRSLLYNLRSGVLFRRESANVGGKGRRTAWPQVRDLSVVKIWIRSWIYLQYLVCDFYRSCLFSFQRFCNWLSVALPGQSPQDRLNILNELRTQNISGNFSFADTNGNFTLLPSSFNVSVVLKSLDEFFQMVVTVFDCINHEYFEGFGDEESLVKRAINTSESPTIASKLTRWDQGTFLGKLPTYPSPKLTLTLLT